MHTTISDLNVGDHARVIGYNTQSHYSQRLLRLGLIPGTSLLLKRRAPLGDPVEIQFRGYLLVLRPAEASCLELENLSSP